MHRKIVAAAVTREPDFVLHTGDLVQDGSDTEQWPIFFDIEKELLRRTVFFPSLGNHERNNPQYYEFFDVRTPYYSFNWGQAHIVVVNSDVGNITADEREAYWKRQTQWLEEDLARSQKAEFRFAVFHHPPYTAMARRQSGSPRSREWLPLFEKYKVQAVFNGHDHNYQRHVKNGVQYITTGGGGAPLYPVDKPIPGLTEKLLSVEHIVDVTVTPGSARIEAVALDGSSIEVVELKP
jgi:3',5'-cyclic AMP phosphodiesterase CpdA